MKAVAFFVDNGSSMCKAAVFLERPKHQELVALSAKSSANMSSNHARKLLLVVLLINWSDAAVIPNVTIASPGDNPVISCSNNRRKSLNFQVAFTPAGSNNPIILYSQSFERINPNFAHQYKFSGNSDSFELTILNASPDHAGTYTCDWDDRSQETELVILAPFGPACESTVLRDDDCETKVRFECSVGFHGNVLPTVEFWMLTDSITIGPITAPAQREHNISKFTLIQTISSVFGDIKYACQLPAINKEGIPSRSYCSFEMNQQSCDSLSSMKDILFIVSVVLAVIVVAAALIAIHRKQLRHSSVDRKED